MTSRVGGYIWFVLSRLSRLEMRRLELSKLKLSWLLLGQLSCVSLARAEVA